VLIDSFAPGKVKSPAVRFKLPSGVRSAITFREATAKSATTMRRIPRAGCNSDAGIDQGGGVSQRIAWRVAEDAENISISAYLLRRMLIALRELAAFFDDLPCSRERASVTG